MGGDWRVVSLQSGNTGVATGRSWSRSLRRRVMPEGSLSRSRTRYLTSWCLLNPMPHDSQRRTSHIAYGISQLVLRLCAARSLYHCCHIIVGSISVSITFPIIICDARDSIPHVLGLSLHDTQCSENNSYYSESAGKVAIDESSLCCGNRSQTCYPQVWSGWRRGGG